MSNQKLHCYTSRKLVPQEQHPTLLAPRADMVSLLVTHHFLVVGTWHLVLVLHTF